MWHSLAFNGPGTLTNATSLSMIIDVAFVSVPGPLNVELSSDRVVSALLKSVVKFAVAEFSSERVPAPVIDPAS